MWTRRSGHASAFRRAAGVGLACALLAVLAVAGLPSAGLSQPAEAVLDDGTFDLSPEAAVDAVAQPGFEEVSYFSTSGTRQSRSRALRRPTAGCSSLRKTVSSRSSTASPTRRRTRSRTSRRTFTTSGIAVCSASLSTRGSRPAGRSSTSSTRSTLRSAVARQRGETPAPTRPAHGDGCVVSGRLSKLTADGNFMTGSEQVLINDWCQQYPSHSVGSLDSAPTGRSTSPGATAPASPSPTTARTEARSIPAAIRRAAWAPR